MQQIHFSVDVNIGLTAALQQFLEGFTSKSSGSHAVAEDVKQEKPAEPKPIAVTPEEQKAELEQVKKETPAVAKLQKNLDLELVEKKPAEIVRAAMAECRTRIEGEGYTKESPYHKELTIEFKKIAQLLGSDKPSELPADKVASFCEVLEHIVVKDDELINEAPF